MAWRKENVITYELGGHRDNVLAIAKLYKEVKEALSLEGLQVPYIKAEDETAIIPRPEYKADTDEVWGFCGRKSGDHICEDSFVVKVGNDDGAYERLVEAFQNCQVATHSRVIMINPLHQNFPKVVLLLQANCNRFTHNEVLHQWLLLDSLCQHILDPVLGPGIGHASDGDSRRRKLMLNQATSSTNTYKPTPFDLGFIMSARIEVTEAGRRVLRDLYDHDSIHNDKKIINPLDHPTRVLRLGRYSAHMNHLRLVMETFTPAVHGMHANDVARKDRQKWEPVQRLKFVSVQQCLLDIATGRNGATKDVSVLGTWAFLYVAWHYTEIFFSLHASLRDRVKYAAFVAIFYSIWRNWIILTDGLSLKDRFLTRECFQDVLLSCHFSVILISFFRDEHPDLECPLELTGTDCCERYFSENGSFIQNRHNYTFLDMHRNLGYMNRIQEIRATNTDIKFPKRKHNNDFIWDKQFPQDQRKKVCNLRDYPSTEEVKEAWKEGVQMAKDLARRLGMHPDEDENEDGGGNDDGGGGQGDDDGNKDDDGNNGGDDKKWFHRPMEYIAFNDSLNGMAAEEELEILRTNAEQTVDDDISQECNEFNTDIEASGDIRHIVNPLLDQVENETGSTDSVAIKKATILVPGVGERYKSTVVAELRSNPNFSTDRLRRIRDASAAAKNVNQSTLRCNSLRLFDDCAFHQRHEDNKFILGRVQRMRKKGKRGYVEYVKPVDLDERPPDVEVLFSKYVQLEEQNSFTQTEEVLVKPLSSVICNVGLNINEHTDIYKLDKTDETVISEFLRTVQATSRTHSKDTDKERGVSNAQMEDDGRRMQTVLTSSGRLSKRVSYLC